MKRQIMVHLATCKQLLHKYEKIFVDLWYSNLDEFILYLNYTKQLVERMAIIHITFNETK